MRHRITAFGVACAFLVCCIAAVWVAATFSGCAMLQIGQPQTFELTIDGEKAIVNLPKDFPSMDKAIQGREMCWDAKLCAQGFCLSDELNHGHVRIFYSGKDVVALNWCSGTVRETCKSWIFEEGNFVEVDSAKFIETLDSIWRKVPNQ